jgi:outer membrane receptor protein involved in Fe transport
MKWRGLLFLVFLNIGLCLNAQGPPAGFNPANAPKIGKISGVILDKSTAMPIEYATITLFSLKDSSVVGGNISDDKGKFEITEVGFGGYALRIELMGFERLVIKPIIIKPDQYINDLGKLELLPSGINLNEVVISAEKAQVLNSIDKQVFNVEKNIVSEGGTAADVLQQVPSVTVDIDGNVSLRGSGNITILIDGKPSGLTGDRSTILSQIPANSIESIEVITNPSAKYDPEGMGGIINVVLKKNKKIGFNGNVGFTLGTRNKYNGTLSLNYRNKKINVFSNYNYRYNQFDNRFTSFRKNILSDTSFGFDQNKLSQSKGNNHLLKGGMDYYLNDYNTIGFSATYGFNKERQLGTNYNKYTDFMDVPQQFETRESDENNKNWNIDASIDYRKTFKKIGQLFTTSLLFSHAPRDKEEYYIERDFVNESFDVPFGKQFLENQFRNQKIQLATLQADYVHPLKKGKIETGYRSNLRLIDINLNILELDTVLNLFNKNEGKSSHFKYTEQIHAVYGQYSNTIKNFGYQLGLRLEQALVKGELLDSTAVNKQRYFTPFPSINMNYKLKKDQEVSLGYSRRVNRPGVQELNPAGDYGDPLNIRIGNPALKPEFINSLNAGYQKNWEKANIVASIFVMQKQNGFMRVRTVDTTSNISYVTNVNLTKSINYGFDFNSKFSITKWWNLNLGGTVFQSKVAANVALNAFERKNTSWTIKAISTMTVWENMSIQLSYNVQGPIVIPQGKIRLVQGLDIAVKKDFLKKKNLSVNIRVTDVVNTRQFAIDLEDPTFVQSFTFKRESLVGYLGISYRFGEADKSAKFQKKSGMDQAPMDVPMF